MIRVRIEDAERELSSASENWINQQINRRRADGHSVCVRVMIQEDNLNMTLSTLSCPKGSSGRPPNQYEEKVFYLWEKCGLYKEQFTGNDLVSFLKRLKA